MAPDRILISNIGCMAAIGVTPEERAAPQKLSIDVEFFTDCRRASANDSLKDAIDYAAVASVVSQTCGSRNFHLVETAAEMIAARILGEFPTPQVRVLVRKISPLIEPRAAYVSVEIVRP